MTTNTDIIEDFGSNLTSYKLRNMESVLRDTQSMVEGFSDADIVTGYKDKMKEIEDAADISGIKEHTVQRKVLVPTSE